MTGEITLENISAGRILGEAINDFSLPEHTKRIVLGELFLAYPLFAADARLLKRVLTNLVSNALKHGGPNTRVHVDAELNDSEICFFCRDNGTGIDPAMLPRLFDAFEFRGNESSSSGLGLAFCKAAVRAHGGRIWCDNSSEQGATFYFSIPIKELQNERYGEESRLEGHSRNIQEIQE